MVSPGDREQFKTYAHAADFIHCCQATSSRPGGFILTVRIPGTIRSTAFMSNSIVVVAAKFLEGLPIGLGNKKCGKAAQ